MIKKFNQFIILENIITDDTVPFPKDMNKFITLINSVLDKIGITYRVDRLDTFIVHYHIDGENTGHDRYDNDDILLFRLGGSRDPNAPNYVTRLKDLNGEWLWGAYEFCSNIEEFTQYLTHAFHIDMDNVAKKINN